MLDEQEFCLLGFGAGFCVVSVLAYATMHKSLKMEKREIYFTSIDRVPEVKRDKDNRKLDKKGIKKEASSVINRFLSTFRSLPHVDLSGIYENFAPYCIEEDLSVPHYDKSSKKIFVNPSDLKNSLLRGLLEMAITREYIKLNEYYMETSFVAEGFTRTIGSDKYSYRIGMGLTNGYKDLILNRYFDVDYRYPVLADIVELIEFQVGREKMEKLFFQGDLREIIRIMGECEDKTWLIDLDKIYEMHMRSPYIVKKKAYSEYRSLLISLTKLAIKKGMDYYEGRFIDSYHLTASEFLDAQLEGRMNGIRIISTVNSIMRNAKVHGIILENDAEELNQFGEKILKHMPSPLRVSI